MIPSFLQRRYVNFGLLKVSREVSCRPLRDALHRKASFSMTQVAIPRSNEAPEASRPERKRVLGLGASRALVVGNMIGSGIFLLPASLAAYGGISIVGWLLTAVGAMFLALMFAKL